MLSWVFSAPVPKATYKLTLLALADCANDEGYCWPSIAALLTKTSLNRKTVVSALSWLRERGVLVDTGERKGVTDSVVVYKVVPETDLLRDDKVCLLGGVEASERDGVSRSENGTGKQVRKRSRSENGAGPFLPISRPVFTTEADPFLPISRPENGPGNHKEPSIGIVKEPSLSASLSLFDSDSLQEGVIADEKIEKKSPQKKVDERERELFAAYREIRHPSVSGPFPTGEFKKALPTLKDFVRDGVTPEQLKRATANALRSWSKREMVKIWSVAKHWTDLLEDESPPLPTLPPLQPGDEIPDIPMQGTRPAIFSIWHEVYTGLPRSIETGRPVGMDGERTRVPCYGFICEQDNRWYHWGGRYSLPVDDFERLRPELEGRFRAALAHKQQGAVA